MAALMIHVFSCITQPCYVYPSCNSKENNMIILVTFIRKPRIDRSAALHFLAYRYQHFWLLLFFVVVFFSLQMKNGILLMQKQRPRSAMQ